MRQKRRTLMLWLWVGLVARRGGKARAEKLTAEQRKEIDRKAANARWGKV